MSQLEYFEIRSCRGNHVISVDDVRRIRCTDLFFCTRFWDRLVISVCGQHVVYVCKLPIEHNSLIGKTVRDKICTTLYIIMHLYRVVSIVVKPLCDIDNWYQSCALSLISVYLGIWLSEHSQIQPFKLIYHYVLFTKFVTCLDVKLTKLI